MDPVPTEASTTQHLCLRLKEPQEKEISYEIIPRNARKYNHEMSPTRLAKHHLNEDNTNKC